MTRQMVLWQAQFQASAERERDGRDWSTPAPKSEGRGGLARPAAALLVAGLVAAPLLRMVWLGAI